MGETLDGTTASRNSVFQKSLVVNTIRIQASFSHFTLLEVSFVGYSKSRSSGSSGKSETLERYIQLDSAAVTDAVL